MNEQILGCELTEQAKYLEYKFVAPSSPNVKLSFGSNSTTYFQYHLGKIPNRFQRWMLLKVLGIKLEKI